MFVSLYLLYFNIVYHFFLYLPDQDIAKPESPKKNHTGCLQTDRSKIVVFTVLISFLLIIYDGLQVRVQINNVSSYMLHSDVMQ